MRVLVAEDDPLVSEMIVRSLPQTDYSVIGRAIDGLMAIEMVRSLQPDVVLMDVAMPKLDGIDATQRIQAVHPTPVVVLTAYDNPDLVAQASAAGAGAYLVKPPYPREMDRAITIAMARFEDMRALRRLNAELEETLSKVKTLSGLLPICAGCKKIRDDEGNWHQIEVYITNHSEADFSHGLCPDCLKEIYSDFYDNQE